MITRKAFLISSRVTFGAFVVLACLSPSWKNSLFAWLPMYRLRFTETTFDVGILFALPLVAWTLWGLAWLKTPFRTAWRYGRWPVAVPVFGFGTLALFRSWPVHLLGTAMVAVMGVLLFWMVYAYTMHAGSMRWVVTLFSLVILIQGLVAAGQFLVQHSLGLTWMGELSLAPEVRGVSVVEAAGHRWLRAYGLAPHPNVLGGYLGAGMLVCLGALPAASTSRRWWLGSCMLAGGLGLFFTFSRAAWLGTLGGLVYGALLTRVWRRINWQLPQTRRILVLAGLAVLVGVGVLGFFYGDLIWARLLASGSELEANSLNERVRDVKQAWGLIRQEPLKGVGTGYYVAALWAGVGSDRPPAFQHVHNIPLLAAAEMGIGGALLWLWLIGGPPLECVFSRRHGCEDLHAGWAGAFVVLLVASLFDHYLYFPMTWWPAFYIGILTGVWAGPVDTKAVAL